jgi:Na+-translocating ferredoxin:NAD+ oxidoreductase RnfD subunit
MEQIIYETTAPHLKSRMTTDKIMKYIIMALLPAGIHGVYRYGLHAGVLILITCAASVMTQIVYEKIAGKHSSVKDCRVLLNGLIMSYCLPPSVNWTVAALAGVVCGLLMSVSVHLFERNLVSPIILTRLILTWIFPEEMSVFVLDGVTMATPLALLKEQQDVNTLFMILGKTGGCIGETSALLLCLGAIFLIAREIIDFRVSGMYLFSFAAFMAIFGGNGLSSYYLTAHLAGGGFMLALWYIAPAYSTLPMTRKGRWLYGVILGVFTGVSRLYGPAPENLCYALLAANLLVPLIESATRSLPFGIEKGQL